MANKPTQPELSEQDLAEMLGAAADHDPQGGSPFFVPGAPEPKEPGRYDHLRCTRRSPEVAVAVMEAGARAEARGREKADTSGKGRG